MLMIIFGAGASYDSDPSHQPPRNDDDRPPLANELFARRQAFANALDSFPQCHPLVPRLRHLPGERSIEEELDLIQNESSLSSRAQQLAAVRFYIQTAVHQCEGLWFERHRGITNYLTLLDDIRTLGNTDVSLVTFNYDRMLERAAQSLARCEISSLDDYLAVGPFKVFKLHGSVDWGRVVTNSPTAYGKAIEQITRSLIESVLDLEISDNFSLGRSNELPLVRDVPNGHVLFPAVAIPLRSKHVFECPADHLEALKGRLRMTDRVVIIGWRGQDAHFTALLQKHLPKHARMQIVCGSPEAAKEVANTLRLPSSDVKYEVLGLTFSQYILQRAGHQLLAEKS